MDRVAVAGLSLHEAELSELERLSRPSPAAEPTFVRELADALAASELVFIATCNRIEVAYAREAGDAPSAPDREIVAGRLGLASGDPLADRLHFFAGADAARHVFRVAASLDSVVLGEGEILAQVREAFTRAEALGLAGRLLTPLFERALQIGKQVRTETELALRPVSVVSLGVTRIAARFRGETPRIAVLGAGRMAALVVRAAREHRIQIAVVANRSRERAEALASGCGARAVGIEAFVRGCEPVDAFVAATSSARYVVEREPLLALARRTPSRRPLVAVDIAVPRNVEPVADSSVEVVDLEALRVEAERNRAERARAAAEAEKLIEKKLAAFGERALPRVVTALLADVSAESRRVLDRELAQLFTGKLEHLGCDERAAVERWARTALGRIQHLPIQAIKRLASDGKLFDGSATGATHESELTP